VIPDSCQHEACTSVALWSVGSGERNLWLCEAHAGDPACKRLTKRQLVADLPASRPRDWNRAEVSTLGLTNRDVIGEPVLRDDKIDSKGLMRQRYAVTVRVPGGTESYFLQRASEMAGGLKADRLEDWGRERTILFVAHEWTGRELETLRAGIVEAVGPDFDDWNRRINNWTARNKEPRCPKCRTKDVSVIPYPPAPEPWWFECNRCATKFDSVQLPPAAARLFLDAFYAKAQEMTRLGRIGTHVHALIHGFLQVREWSIIDGADVVKYSDADIVVAFGQTVFNCICQFREFWSEHDFEVVRLPDGRRALERMVWDIASGVAGTFDALLRDRKTGKTYLVDYKTSKGVFAPHVLQDLCYGGLLATMGLGAPDFGLILCIGRDAEFFKLFYAWESRAQLIEGYQEFCRLCKVQDFTKEVGNRIKRLTTVGGSNGD